MIVRRRRGRSKHGGEGTHREGRVAVEWCVNPPKVNDAPRASDDQYPFTEGR